MSEKINIKICKQRISNKNYFIFGVVLTLLISLSSGGYVGYNVYKKKDTQTTPKPETYTNKILVVVSILFFITFIILTFFLIKDIKATKHLEYPCYLEESNEIMTDDKTKIPFNNNYYISDLPSQPVITTKPPATTKQPDIQQNLQQENKANLNSTTNISANNVPNAIINSSTNQGVDNSVSQAANKSSNVNIDDTSLYLDNKNVSSNANITNPNSQPEVDVESRANASSNVSGDVNINKGNNIII